MSQDQLTKHQAAVIGAFTGILAGPFNELQEYVEGIMDEPTWTHEMALRADEIKEAARPDFMAIVRGVDTE